jgi:tubulin-specific chaperone A
MGRQQRGVWACIHLTVSFSIYADQRRILEESHRMIKDSDNRLGKAVQDLRELVVRLLILPIVITPDYERVFFFLGRKLRVKAKPEFAEDDELVRAEDALEEASV